MMSEVEALMMACGPDASRDANSNEQADVQGSKTPFMSKTLSVFVSNDECGKGTRHVIALIRRVDEAICLQHVMLAASP